MSRTSEGPVGVLLRLLDDASEFALVADHLDGCPERGNPDANGCACEYVERKRKLAATIAEAKDLIDTYT